MAKVLEAVQIYKKVEDVTAQKDDPPPVYLMDELAEMARSSPESAEKIADRISKRLQQKSPVIKYKALRLTKHIINKGCSQFQRHMQRHANLIRELIHFKGEPDPYKGDIPNQRVRETAKEASEALFSAIAAPPPSHLGNRIEGFGFSGSSAPPPAGASRGGAPTGGMGVSATGSSSRMVGFGSSSFEAGGRPPGSGTSTSYSSTGISAGANKQGVNRPLTLGQGYSTENYQHQGSGLAYAAPSVTAAEVMGTEEQLVNDICTPGGMRLAPDAEDLRKFVEAASNMDGLHIAELLREKMENTLSWQQVLRALYALEAVMTQGSSQACGEIAVMFQSDPAPVEVACMHTQASIRERAARVLRLLVGDANMPPSAASVGSASSLAAPPQAQPTTATRTQAYPPSADLLGGAEDLLGGLMAPAPAPAPSTAPLNQLYPTVSAQLSGDIFSGLLTPSGSATAVPQAFSALQPGTQQQQHYPPTQQEQARHAQQPAGSMVAGAAEPAVQHYPAQAAMQYGMAPSSQQAAGMQQRQQQALGAQDLFELMAPVQPVYQHQQQYGAPVAGMMPSGAMQAQRPGMQAQQQQVQPVGGAAAPAGRGGARAGPLEDVFADLAVTGGVQSLAPGTPGLISGQATPAGLASIGSSASDLQGLSGNTGYVPLASANASASASMNQLGVLAAGPGAASSGGMGTNGPTTPTGGVAAGLHRGAGSAFGGPAMQPAQMAHHHQQQGGTSDLLGGYDLLGDGGLAASGPAAGMPAPQRAAGLPATGQMQQLHGMGTAMQGPIAMGMPGAAHGLSLAAGMAGASGAGYGQPIQGSMMVGPGGQMQYVVMQPQPGSGMSAVPVQVTTVPMGGMGAGGVQHMAGGGMGLAPQGMQQQQPMMAYGMGMQQQQQPAGGRPGPQQPQHRTSQQGASSTTGAPTHAFDFVMDQFK